MASDEIKDTILYQIALLFLDENKFKEFFRIGFKIHNPSSVIPIPLIMNDIAFVAKLFAAQL